MEPDDIALLGPETSLRQVLEQVCRTLIDDGLAWLPSIDGLSGPVAARWLFRTCLLEAGSWQPLHLVDPRHLAALPEGDAGWWSAARGGWIYLGPGPVDQLPPGLMAECRAHRIRLLVQDGEPSIPAPMEWAREVLRLDPFHATRTDPGLEHVRRSLLAHCRALSPIHLSGEPGTGKALLARWAHAMLDERPLSHIRGDTGRPQPGEWTLFEEVGELSVDRRAFLEARLRDHNTPPPLARAPRRRARPAHPAFNGIVGDSVALVGLLEQVLALAPSRLAILITGESGVGKEAIARAIHAASDRPGSFVALDVGTLPESLAESALFGHRRGAFTGAERHRAGAFRSADGGTLFLDEVGNLSPAHQVRLLRALQESEVQPLGEDAPVRVDVRVLAATNADLEALVRRGAFRADLLARLNAATLELPPLRDRLEDLEALAVHFLTLERGRPPAEPWSTPAARAALEAHHWPGNIRELSNVIRFAAAVAPQGPIDAVHLGPLSPHNRRRTPVITTSSHARPAEAWGIDRGLAQVMMATTLHLPALRDRPRSSRQHAILGLLGGRPIHAAALRRLEEQPWWGNGVELEAALAALRALPPGGIDVACLEQQLPHLAKPAGLAPIRVLLSPARTADGRVGGLMRDFTAGALLVGRIRSLEELELAARAGDRRVRAPLEALSGLCGVAVPDCLELGLLNRLSRAHFLVTRAGQGFRVHLLPSAGLPVSAGPLEPAEAPLRPVTLERPIELGTAGEVQVLGSDGRPYLRLFVFAGGVAFDEHAATALARVEAQVQPATPTVAHTAMPLTPAPEPVAPGLRVWAVDPAEEKALTRMLTEFRGGQLKAHVARYVGMLREPGYARLVDYLERAPRLSQYLVRLYEHPENGGLREGLRTRLEAEPDREIRLALLPEGLRRCLEVE